MPDLKQSLLGHDLGHLRIMAKLWGVELDAPDFRVGLQRLVPLLLSRELVEEVVQALPKEAQKAVQDLLGSEGRIPWSLFTRRYGEVREMGIAQRNRELPYKENASISEALWYRGIVGRNFFDTPNGPEEFAYIPLDLMAIIPPAEGKVLPVLGRPASAAEKNVLALADDSILDESCTLLAALRMGWETLPKQSPDLETSEIEGQRISPIFLKELLIAAGFLDSNGKPLPEPTRIFLEASRSEALVFLVRAWMNSREFNELHLMPGLIVEGEWKNDPHRARQAILGFLSTVPQSQVRGSGTTEPSFWSLQAFVEAIHQAHPDFQRAAGDYDSWYLKDQATGKYLRCFEHWDEVDGALIRFLITGPLHWLGILDLALPVKGRPGTSFRFSRWASDLLNLNAPQGMGIEQDKMLVSSNARLSASRSVSRTVRYQVARFCQLEETSADGYRFRLTPGSLKAARQQGLRIQHLLTLLRHHAKYVPPSLVKALERWEERGREISIHRPLVLSLKDPELIKELRTSKASRYLGELLGPTAVIIKNGSQEKILAILAEMGYLGEVEDI
jgi:hypothetical protein